MPTIIVKVEYYSKAVFNWEGLPVHESLSVGEFYQTLVKHEIDRELWNKDITVYFSRTKIGEKEKIGLKCNVWETAKQYGEYVMFKLKDENHLDDEFTTQTINAFDLMRAASMLNYLPEFTSPNNSFDKLRIDLNEWIKNNGGGWIGKDIANTIGKKFVTDLSKAIWYVDSCSYKTMNDRIKIPEIFVNFFDRAHPEAYNKARKSFNADELQHHHKILFNYLELPWMFKPKFSWLREPLKTYSMNLLKYADYLIDQKINTAKNQNSLIPIVDECLVSNIEVINATYWRLPKIIEEFKLLTKALEESSYWEPVNINQYCPNSRM